MQSLEASEITANDLSVVAVCIGPGSYTGVRIGISMAKGLATARQLPLVGVSTLDILAAAQPADTRPLYALFTAGRRRIGYARYRWGETGWQAETEVTMASYEELSASIDESALVIGEMDAAGQTLLRARPHITLPPPAYHLRRAAFLADLAWERLRQGQTDDPTTLQPLYTR